MARKILGAVASCIAIVLALTVGELPRATAIQDQHKRSKHRHAISRRNRAARQRVKSQQKPARVAESDQLCLPDAPGHALELARHMSQVLDGFGGGRARCEEGAALSGALPRPVVSKVPA
jgi:hypothetical protein